VFGVKESLLVNLGTVDSLQAAKYGAEEGSKLMTYEFVLVSEEEAKALREQEAKKAMTALGLNMQWIDGLPVPEVD